MDGLTHFDSFINNCTAEEKRRKAMDNRSPWSSGSGSTSPLPSQKTPNRLSLFDKSYSGGSTNSLGSSPGNEVRSLTCQTSLTVPEFNLPPSKVNRSTSPFYFLSSRKEKKKLEKQSNCLDDSAFSSCDGLYEEAQPVETNKAGRINPFKEFRKKRKDPSSSSSTSSSPFSLFKKSSEKETGPTLCSSNSLSIPGVETFATSPSSGGYGNFYSQKSLSRSPPSPNSQCKCRRCSILHLEECEPKEMSALFKFLRKSKVKMMSAVCLLIKLT